MSGANVVSYDTITINHPQHHRCRVVVVVPVYDERPARIIDQLETLASQSVDPELFEVIYVVNNSPARDDDEWRRSYDANQAVLGLPVFRNRITEELGEFSASEIAQFDRLRRSLRIYAIDMSSEGQSEPDSNVGLARQRALLEAAGRFERRGITDGIMVYSDADCRFVDIEYLAKALDLFDGDPSLIGAAGHSKLVLDPDDGDDTELFRSRAKRFVMYRRWKSLTRAILRGEGTRFSSKFLGMNLAFRAREGILAGGFDPVNFCSDVLFGDKLRLYADTHGGTIEAPAHDLWVEGALRISDRTGNSYRADFEFVWDGEVMVDDPLQPGSQVPLNSDSIAELERAVSLLPGGVEHLAYLNTESQLHTMVIG